VIVLGVLVLLCAGLLSYLGGEGYTNSVGVTLDTKTVTTRSQVGGVRDYPPDSPYRQEERFALAGRVATR